MNEQGRKRGRREERKNTKEQGGCSKVAKIDDEFKISCGTRES